MLELALELANYSSESADSNADPLKIGVWVQALKSGHSEIQVFMFVSIRALYVKRHFIMVFDYSVQTQPVVIVYLPSVLPSQKAGKGDCYVTGRVSKSQ